jgi:methylphosphotriester-DNA--protein-cysteine methyltransferase
VWVADGYPEYHVEGCDELTGLAGEPIPYEQAVEDGFQPCVVCNPDRALTSGASQPATDMPATGPAARQPQAAAAVATLPAPTGAPADVGEPAAEVLVIDGFPSYHLAGCHLLVGHETVLIPREQAVEDGFTPCDVCDPDGPVASTGDASGDVWVVDGFPDYHRADCPTLTDLPAEAIPHDQAVEDGFAPCSVCTPEAGSHPEALRTAAAPDPQTDSAVEDAEDVEVWVVDGYPEYHRQGCERLADLDDEPIPHSQAVEDGFVPCPVCRPDDPAGSTTPADEPAEPEPEPVPEPEPEGEPEPVADEASAQSREVWVIDGRPRYHAADCLIIKGRSAQPVSLEQAVQDGFQPCSLCQRRSFVESLS